MDPDDPVDAQQIVIAYARVLERDVTEGRHPARVDSLPYAKPIIKSAIRASAGAMAASGQLTDELRDYLETAYVLLAEYLDGELVELMSTYRSSAQQLATEALSARDRPQTVAWRTLTDTGTLAGEVARSVTAETEVLRKEFRAALTSR